MPMPPRALTPERSPSHRLGAALRELRTGKFSQLGLAKKVHVSKSMIAMIERGERIGAPEVIEECDTILEAHGALSALWRQAAASRTGVGRPASHVTPCYNPGTTDDPVSRIRGAARPTHSGKASTAQCCVHAGSLATNGPSGPTAPAHQTRLGHALARVEHVLTVTLDRESLVHGRSSVSARTDRGTWVRIESRNARVVGEHGWNGVETAAALSDVARPDWFGTVTWRDEAEPVVWRADEIALVESTPVEPAGILTEDPRLPQAWWRTLSSSLDALSGFRTTRIAVSQATPVTQEHVTSVIEQRWPGRVDSVVDDWACAHAGMTWAKITSPVCWVLGWSDWGLAPRGLDAATLWACSLAVPEIAGRIWRDRQADLESPTGMITALYSLARLAALAPAADTHLLECARQEAARLLSRLVNRAG